MTDSLQPKYLATKPLHGGLCVFIGVWNNFQIVSTILVITWPSAGALSGRLHGLVMRVFEETQFENCLLSRIAQLQPQGFAVVVSDLKC